MHRQFAICNSFAILIAAFLAACSKTDPVLEGRRVPVFDSGLVEISDEMIPDLGRDLAPEKCDFRIDSENRIWRGEALIFRGLATESEFDIRRTAACRGEFVYAGLSTGELVKVNAGTKETEWVADIFASHTPTGNTPFLDIIAAPVYNGGFVYAGGLGGAFCKIKDSTGAKVWCLPIGVQEIRKSTKKFNVILTTDGQTLAISTEGKAYKNYKL